MTLDVQKLSDRLGLGLLANNLLILRQYHSLDYHSGFSIGRISELSMGAAALQSDGQLRFSKLERTGSAVLRFVFREGQFHGSRNCQVSGENCRHREGPDYSEKCEFNPNKTGVEKVEVGCPAGTEMVITVHFTAVDNEDMGIAIATRIHNAILDRISISRDIAIENGQPETALSPINTQNGVITVPTGSLTTVANHSKVSLSFPWADLKPILEEAAPTGERYFPFLRSARLSTSPVEEFMRLYNILLMLFNDEQAEIEKFIFEQNPGVRSEMRPKFKRPQRKSLEKETVYTRLRNELGHNRTGGNLDKTQAEMKKCLDELRALTKRAIELHS